ncbi:MAG: hypothetical protein M1472_02210, partial [Planctomycetes bacterium]|nr:hypothetical protein [Planctomycetota bacterium]
MARRDGLPAQPGYPDCYPPTARVLALAARFHPSVRDLFPPPKTRCRISHAADAGVVRSAEPNLPVP